VCVCVCVKSAAVPFGRVSHSASHLSRLWKKCSGSVKTSLKRQRKENERHFCDCGSSDRRTRRIENEEVEREGARESERAGARPSGTI